MKESNTKMKNKIIGEGIRLMSYQLKDSHKQKYQKCYRLVILQYQEISNI